MIIEKAVPRRLWNACVVVSTLVLKWLACPKFLNDVYRLHHAVVNRSLVGVNAEHVHIGWACPRAYAEVQTTPRHVVQLRNSKGNVRRVVEVE